MIECLRERSPRTRSRQSLGVALLAAAATLAGCSTLKYESSEATKSDARTYVVRKGDTLYTIAWQHRVDQRDLARWNGIKDPDVIQVGQRLRLEPASAPAPERRAAASEAKRPSSGPPASSRASPPAAKSGTAAPPRAAPVPSAPPVVLPAPAWSWPTDGQVVTRFGAADGIATGIGIGGREGQPIRAAAAGRVVYAGSGLMSYGQLLIIKHNESYLSAYGYNSRLLVSQGQDVAKGQTIAAMGRGPEREPRLHFEIRRNGVPVDPLLLVSEK
ncbi:MAG TPA: peptidoglycan DD-metalloendopeptidase family protein [Gammaproteobacteria bacterium]|nr:peptidoglycan DD-metalloendopeptidase family protein [Gammaproteobacteria bacterium]